MIELSATIRNAQGIHCRPSAVIAKETVLYKDEIAVITENGVCDPRSVMALITMGLQEGAKIRIRVTGPNEKKLAPRLAELFETNFDFPPRDDGQPAVPREFQSSRAAINPGPT